VGAAARAAAAVFTIMGAGAARPTFFVQFNAAAAVVGPTARAALTVTTGLS
jgi:hypothetical protein